MFNLINTLYAFNFKFSTFFENSVVSDQLASLLIKATLYHPHILMIKLHHLNDLAVRSLYGKCSKISNTCLPKRPRQTAQSQIRLLLKKQSDQGLCYLLI